MTGPSRVSTCAWLLALVLCWGTPSEPAKTKSVLNCEGKSTGYLKDHAVPLRLHWVCILVRWLDGPVHAMQSALLCQRCWKSSLLSKNPTASLQMTL